MVSVRVVNPAPICYKNMNMTQPLEGNFNMTGENTCTIHR